jgi:hypothetical protein
MITRYFKPDIAVANHGESGESLRSFIRANRLAKVKAFAPGDNTHQNNYGSYELGQCVVQGIRDAQLRLTKHLINGLLAFDPARPAHPDPTATFTLPADPVRPSPKPYGN